MSLQKLKNLPGRFREDSQIVRLAKNWPELLSAKVRRRNFSQIFLRNGIVLKAPNEIALNFLFHEIWINEFYSGRGYEIQPGETVVDIGGNIGVFALWAGTRAADVRVYSFEPFPDNAEFFNANVEESGASNIWLRIAGVSDKNGRKTLKIDDEWIMHSVADDAGADGLEIDCLSLDSALEDISKCHFLKLDCEGSEYSILYPASGETLKKIRRIICEYNDVDEDQRNGRSLAKFLENEGFVVDELRQLDTNSGVIRARRK